MHLGESASLIVIYYDDDDDDENFWLFIQASESASVPFASFHGTRSDLFRVIQVTNKVFLCV
jgi:hypothetical protein